MKRNPTIIWSLVLVILVAALYRVIPGRPYGFAPQISIALFSGALFRKKIWAFILPLAAMFISDAIYQLLYVNGLSVIQGFYQGLWINYLVFASIAVVGFFMRRMNWVSVTGHSLAAAVWFFLLSNFTVWLSGGGLFPGHSWASLVSTYAAGLPFFGWSVAASLLFSGVLFGGYMYYSQRHTERFPGAFAD